MTPAIDITAEQRRTVLALLNRHLPDTTVWACGSRVKWTSRPESDLDLVVFARPEQSAQVAELREAFEESDLPFRVDLFVWDEVPVGFRARIEADHVVLVELEQRTSNGWSTVTLGDYIEINDSAYTPKEAWPFVNYLDTGNITENRIGEIQHLIAGKDRIPSRARRKVQPGDIVYSTVRPNQKHFGLLKSIPDNFLASTGFSVIRGKTDFVCTDFIFWFLAQDHIVEQLHTIAEHSTSAYPAIRSDDIERLTLNLPPLSEQRAIAHILGTLDDKIELHRRMNETLEAMARALFKSWFVDFAPVRAKMEGRDTGLPKGIADLFPDRFVDSECGEIPQGWKAGCLADIAIAPRRNVDPANLDDETPYIGLEHMPRRSIALTAWEKIGKVMSNKSIFKEGEVLFGKLRPYFHKVGVAPINGACSTDIVVIASRSTEWSAFVLACVSSVEFVSYTNQGSTGTKMPRTNWTTMGDYRICLPATPVVGVFQNAMKPVLEQITANVHESRTLATLRDTLLPKLISGEIRLRDAARQVESVA